MRKLYFVALTKLIYERHERLGKIKSFISEGN